MKTHYRHKKNNKTHYRNKKEKRKHITEIQKKENIKKKTIKQIK